MTEATESRRVLRSSPHHESNKPEKKSLLKSPGSLMIAALGIGFVGYVFNVHGLTTFIDGYFGGLNQAARNHDQQVSNVFIGTLPLIAGAVVVLIAIAVLRALGPSKRSLAQTEAREVSGIESFADAAEERGVSKKVSRVAYRMLLPHVRKAKRLGIHDTLCKDLKVGLTQVSDLYGALLRHTDRRRTTGDDGTQLRTVIELMQAVEGSADKSAPTATVLAFKGAEASAARPVALDTANPAVKPVAIATAAAALIDAAKPKKPAAVLVHPARLARRELSMIRSRSFRRAR